MNEDSKKKIDLEEFEKLKVEVNELKEVKGGMKQPICSGWPACNTGGPFGDCHD